MRSTRRRIFSSVRNVLLNDKKSAAKCSHRARATLVRAARPRPRRRTQSSARASIFARRSAPGRGPAHLGRTDVRSSRRDLERQREHGGFALSLRPYKITGRHVGKGEIRCLMPTTNNSRATLKSFHPVDPEPLPLHATTHRRARWAPSLAAIGSGLPGCSDLLDRASRGLGGARP